MRLEGRVGKGILRKIGALVIAGLVYGCGGLDGLGPTGMQLIDEKKLTKNSINSCKGDFYVFGERNSDPVQPYGAVLTSTGFSIGNVGILDEKKEKSKALSQYLQGEVNEQHYNFVDEDVNGKRLCGIVHNNAVIQVDKGDNNAIYIDGPTRGDAGGDGDSGGGG